MRISWSGLGFLFFPLYLVVICGAGAAGSSIDNKPLSALAAAGVLAVGAVLGTLFGMLLNRGNGGHTVMGLNVELGGIFLAVLAWIAVAVSVGLATTKLVGWLAFFSPVIIGFVLALQHVFRNMKKGLESRRALAKARGWKYQGRMPELVERYQDSPDKDAAKGAYGVLFGEVEGTRFTAWDTLNDEVRSTHWALHLPAGFDAVKHHSGGGLTSDNAALAAHLWTAQVAAATHDLSLDGWFLHHADLVFSRPVPAEPGYFTADQLVSGAAVLLRLVHAFPADFPATFGQPLNQGASA